MLIDDGLVRIKVVLQSRKTCISMDSELFTGLIGQQGSREAAVEWVRVTAAQVDNDTEFPKMGLSRKIHRQAYRELLREHHQKSLAR